MFYPAGWRAVVDGVSTDIRRVNYLLRGVPVPAGDHVVKFEFAPNGHRVGIWLAWISTIVVYGGVLLLVFLNWRSRREESEAIKSPADH